MKTSRNVSVFLAISLITATLLCVVSDFYELPHPIELVSAFVTKHGVAFSLLCLVGCGLAVPQKNHGVLPGILCVLSGIMLNRNALIGFLDPSGAWCSALADQEKLSRVLLGLYFLIFVSCIFWMLCKKRCAPQAPHSEKQHSGSRSTDGSQPIALIALVLTMLTLLILLLNGDQHLEEFQDISLSFLTSNSLAAVLLTPLVIFFAIFLVLSIVVGLVSPEKSPSWMTLLKNESPEIGRGLMALAINLLRGFVNLANQIPDFFNTIARLLIGRNDIFPHVDALVPAKNHAAAIDAGSQGSERGAISELLRHAAAYFALASLITTTKGMQNYVFNGNQKWLAYLVSFAIQAVLVGCGLSLCPVFSAIGKAVPSKRRQLAMKALVTILFAAMLVTSSTFSYIYIAEVAYGDSWAGDAETKIVTTLTSETRKLEQENDFQEKEYASRLLTVIRSVLRPAAEQYQRNQALASSERLASLNPEEFALKDISIKSTVDALKKRHPEQSDNLSVLQEQYEKSFRDPLKQAAADYNAAVKRIGALDGNTLSADDVDAICQTLAEISTRIDTLLIELESFQSYIAREDLKPIKSGYRIEAALLQSRIDSLLKHIASATDLPQGTMSGSGIAVDVDKLERSVLMCRAGQASSADVEKVAEQAARLLQHLSDSGMLSVSQLENVSHLSDLIDNYGRCRRLSENIQTFQSERISKTYFFSGEGAVEIEVWRTERNADFYTFFELIHSLPAPSEGMEPSAYDVDAVFQSVSALRRNLIGDYTVFERAIGYLRSDYKLMAIVSAFIALLFDLSSFLIGCFLYAFMLDRRDGSKGGRNGDKASATPRTRHPRASRSATGRGAIK